MITQKALAEQLNVSPQAVSFALNGTGRLADETRELILAAAKAAGYQPNIAARAMAQKRYGCVALVQHHVARFSYIHEEMLQVLQGHLNDQGYHLKMVWVNPDDVHTAQDLSHLATKYQVDALLMNLFFPEVEKLKTLMTCERTPVVWLNVKEPFNCVYPDDYQAGRLMARQLLEKDITQFIYCDRSFHHGVHHYSKEDRWKGVKDEIADRGFEVTFLDRADRDTLRNALKGQQGKIGFVSYSTNEIEAILITLLENFPEMYGQLSFSTVSDVGGFGPLPIERLFWPGRSLAEKVVIMLDRLLDSPSQRLASNCVHYIDGASS